MPLAVNHLNGFNAGGSVTYGTAPAFVVNSNYAKSGASPHTQAHTRNASTLSLVLFVGGNVTPTAATYGGVACTQIGSYPLFYINGPASGSQTISVTNSGSGTGHITVTEFDQYLEPSALNSSTGNPASLTITPTTALTGVQMWWADYRYGTSGPSMSGTGVTNIGDYQWLDEVVCCGHNYSRAGTARKTNVGAATTTSTISGDSSNMWGCVIGPAPL